jgi:hypothetical protein
MKALLNSFIDSLDPGQSYSRRDLRQAAADFFGASQEYDISDIVIGVVVSTTRQQIKSEVVLPEVQLSNSADPSQLIHDAGVELIGKVVAVIKR